MKIQYGHYKNTRRLNIPIEGDNESLEDVIVEITLKDGTNMSMNLPLRSLAMVSGYANHKLISKLKSDYGICVDFHTSIIVKSICAMYENLGIEIENYRIMRADYENGIQ